jgi:hypothetical protein
MLQHQQFTYTVTGHYQHFSSEPEECFEVDANDDDDEIDPDWTLSTEKKCIDNASSAIIWLKQIYVIITNRKTFPQSQLIMNIFNLFFCTLCI